jgi:hypothetical protein
VGVGGWYGVVCHPHPDGGRRVHTLSLANEKLGGTLYPGLATGLGSLARLQLRGNKFTGTIPQEWAAFTRLYGEHTLSLPLSPSLCLPLCASLPRHFPPPARPASDSVAVSGSLFCGVERSWT